MINLNLEAQLLAAMLNNEDHLCSGLSDLSKDDFTEPLHRRVFETAGNMYRSNLAVNALTVYEHIKDYAQGRGVSWMVLKEAYWPGGTFEHHAKMLKDMTRRRVLVKFAQDLLQKIEAGAETSEALSFAETAIYSVSTETAQEPIVTPQEQAERILQTVSDCMDVDKRSRTNIFTSFQKLNRHTGGFESGDLVIVSAPTGGGKSAFGMNLLRDISVTQRISGLLVNTEMSARQLDLRWAALLSPDSGLTNTALRIGAITDQQYQRLPEQLNGIYQSGLYSITIPNLTVPKMLATIRRFAVQKSIQVAVIDYIGRCDLQDTKDSRDEWQLLLSAARKLKTMAQEYGLVVFMLAQVDAQGKLAMAKYMQHECDLHLHIRPLSDDEKADCLTRMEVSWDMAISIEKSRNGPRGVIPVRFAGEKLKFIDDAKEAAEYAKLVGESPQKSGNHTASNRARRPYRKGDD